MINSIEDIQRLLTSGFTNWEEYGNVNVKSNGALTIFSYNRNAAIEARWNFFEIVSRGLIINNKTGEVIARPFDKFFNWGEGGRFSNSEITSVMEKMDGSLGILYRYNGQHYIATRGSFDSEQAMWATEHLNENYPELSKIPDELTLLFEIIYPSNRIVVNYGGFEGLFLLAVRNRFTGEFIEDLQRFADYHEFNTPEEIPFSDIESVTSSVSQMDGNEEGYVVTFSNGQMFKFKSAEYVRIHRLLSKVTTKSLVKQLIKDSDLDTEFIPPSFLSRIKAIEHTVDVITNNVNILFQFAPKESRKEFAMWVVNRHPEYAPYLFALLDGHDLTPIIYKHHDWE